MTSAFGERALRRNVRIGGEDGEALDRPEPATPRKFIAVSGLLHGSSDPITAALEPRQSVLEVLKAPSAVIRRLTVTDEETGEELRPLTVRDLLDGLSPVVQRRLSALPSAMLQGLASLPAEAQRALLGLPSEIQLQIIEALHGGGARPGVGPGAMVKARSEHQKPSGLGQGGLPPDFADFLFGRVQTPDWLMGLRIVIPRPRPNGPLMLGGAPAPDLGDIRPPYLSAEGNKGRRESYGEHLSTHREVPAPSGNKVEASPEVEKFGLDHVALAKAKEEAHQDEKWSSRSAGPHGQEVRKAAETDRGKELAGVTQKINHFERFGKVQSRKKTKEHIDAETKLNELQNPPDLDEMESKAALEWKTDLLSLRKAGLSRDAIDQLVSKIPTTKLHVLLSTNGATAIARVASRLPPARTANLLKAFDGKLPVDLTDEVADALLSLLKAGAREVELADAITFFGSQMSVLISAPASSCLKLLGLENRPRLKLMLEGGQNANLAALAGLANAASIELLIKAVPGAAELGQLFASGAGPVASLLGCKLSLPVMQLWFLGPTRPSTIALLARPDLPHCLPMLPSLAQDKVGPVELMGPLNAGVPALVLTESVAYAPKLNQKPGQALAYFLANPTNTLPNYQTSIARPVSTAAGLGQAATISSMDLMMLLGEGYARITYSSTFKTTTESNGGGGDTEEYDVETRQPNDTWVQGWVVHLHRAKGDNKASAPVAAHLKRWAERKQKVATRIPVSADLAKKCRLQNNA